MAVIQSASVLYTHCAGAGVVVLSALSVQQESRCPSALGPAQLGSARLCAALTCYLRWKAEQRVHKLRSRRTNVSVERC